MSTLVSEGWMSERAVIYLLGVYHVVSAVWEGRGLHQRDAGRPTTVQSLLDPSS